MASSLPPVKGSAFTFYVALVSQADTDIFKTSVTLAAGDVKVSKDGGAFANITSLPTEIGTSGVLAVALSDTEMNADVVVVKFTDAAGSEWQDALVTIYTAAQTLDTTDGVVDGVASSLAAGVTLADDAITSAKFDESTAFPLKAADSGVTYIMRTGADGDTAESLSDQLDALNDLDSAAVQAAAAAALTAYDPPTDAEMDAGFAALPADIDTQLSGTHGAGAWGSSTGATDITYTVTAGGLPLAGVYCRMTTDAAGLINVDAGTTNAAGEVTFHHDLASGTTVYIWRTLAGYAFSDPDTEVIP